VIPGVRFAHPGRYFGRPWGDLEPIELEIVVKSLMFERFGHTDMVERLSDCEKNEQALYLSAAGLFRFTAEEWAWMTPSYIQERDPKQPSLFVDLPDDSKRADHQHLAGLVLDGRCPITSFFAFAWLLESLDYRLPNLVDTPEHERIRGCLVSFRRLLENVDPVLGLAKISINWFLFNDFVEEAFLPLWYHFVCSIPAGTRGEWFEHLAAIHAQVLILTDAKNSVYQQVRDLVLLPFTRLNVFGLPDKTWFTLDVITASAIWILLPYLCDFCNPRTPICTWVFAYARHFFNSEEGGPMREVMLAKIRALEPRCLDRGYPYTDVRELRMIVEKHFGYLPLLDERVILNPEVGPHPDKWDIELTQ